MRDRNGRVRRVLGLGAAIVVAAGTAGAAEMKIRTISTGLSFDNFSRTVVWKGDAASAVIRANTVAARADLGFRKGVVLSLSAGLSLTDFEGLAFNSLPITLEFAGPSISGLVLGAEVLAPLLKSSDFEISGTGRFVYSLGMSKTWPLEDFAVEGKAKGKPGWMEASVGPRVSYLFFGRVIPYLEVCARWLRADFKMTETLADLEGTETKIVRGDISFSAALGVDGVVTDWLTVKAKAGVLPYVGGVDTMFSVGLLYKF